MEEKHKEMLQLWHAMVRIHHYFTNREIKCEKEESTSITLSQLRVISVITDHVPRPMMLKEIASELELTPSAVSQVVDSLCQNGMLVRRPQDGDRRSIAISLSPEGEAFIRNADRKISTQLSSLLADIPQEKQAVFQEVLLSILERITNRNNIKQTGEK